MININQFLSRKILKLFILSFIFTAIIMTFILAKHVVLITAQSLNIGTSSAVIIAPAATRHFLR